jgi:hypothetical protein
MKDTVVVPAWKQVEVDVIAAKSRSYPPALPPAIAHGYGIHEHDAVFGIALRSGA